MTNFEQVLDGVLENYKQKVEVIHHAAQEGKAASRSELNALMNASAQMKLVSLLRLHIKKGLIADEPALKDFLNRAKATAVRERNTSSLSIIALCDRLLASDGRNFL